MEVEVERVRTYKRNRDGKLFILFGEYEENDYTLVDETWEE